MATPRNNHTQPLDGRRILICRPQPEAQRLAAAFEAAGARVRILPTIARQPLEETPEQREVIQNLDQFHHVISVSPYAARLLLEKLDTWWPQAPLGLQWYAVGQGTAAVLHQAGLSPHSPGNGWTSEDLLALPELARVADQKILLARGEDGRELIHDTLSARGARVTLLPLYRRYRPDYDDQTLTDTLRDFAPEAVVALSGETLNNLIALGENTDHNLEQALLVVPVERVAQQARSAGFSHPCIPDSLADDAIVAAVAGRLSHAK